LPLSDQSNAVCRIAIDAFKAISAAELASLAYIAECFVGNGLQFVYDLMSAR